MQIFKRQNHSHKEKSSENVFLKILKSIAYIYYKIKILRYIYICIYIYKYIYNNCTIQYI